MKINFFLAHGSEFMAKATSSYVSTTERVAGIGKSSQKMRKGKNFLSPKKTHYRTPSGELGCLQPGSWLSITIPQATAWHICSLSTSAAFAIVMWISQYLLFSGNPSAQKFTYEKQINKKKGGVDNGNLNDWTRLEGKKSYMKLLICKWFDFMSLWADSWA